MKKLIFISVLAILLSSCTTIGFENPVPNNTKSLTEFPQELIGTYYDGEKDTLRIYKTSYVYGRPDSTVLFMNDTLKKGLIELKKFNDYYILNKKSDKAEIWGILPFTFRNGKIEVYFANLDTKKESLKVEGDTSKIKIETVINMLDKITPVTSIIKEGSSENDYIINPTNEELNKILEERYFIKVIEFSRIK